MQNCMTISKLDGRPVLRTDDQNKLTLVLLNDMNKLDKETHCMESWSNKNSIPKIIKSIKFIRIPIPYLTSKHAVKV